MVKILKNEERVATSHSDSPSGSRGVRDSQVDQGPESLNVLTHFFFAYAKKMVIICNH